jgi:dihydrofolate reductase
MRKVLYAMLVSLDGFIEAPHGDISWTDPVEELHRHFNEQDGSLSAFLYGRGMYETMSAFWPTADQDPAAPEFVKEYARIWREKPKVVFSETLARVAWNARLVKGDIAEEVDRLKAQPGGDMSVSGANLAAAFMRLGLIDEVSLYVHPILLGGGKPMFRPLQDRIPLQLAETRAFGNGVVLLRYRRGV